jgi:succinate-semialdehyde dehydrogenase / glutarate-semialdehyde dehydrogenase
MLSKFRNTGQTCVCANRLLVQSGVYDAFTAKLADTVKALKVTEAFSEGAQQGPLINMAAIEKVEDHIRDALSQGARVVVGGERHLLGPPSSSRRCWPMCPPL